MSLEDEILAVIREMPDKHQRIVLTAVAGIHALCALADALEPEISLGAVAVSVIGAKYQDKEESTT
jgi:3-dehydroquinate dehydratase